MRERYETRVAVRCTALIIVIVIIIIIIIIIIITTTTTTIIRYGRPFSQAFSFWYFS